MATKLGKVVTYYEKLPSIKIYTPLNMWPCNKSKTFIQHYHLTL